MNVHILDDWFDTLRRLPCFKMLDGHDVTVWTDHEPDEAALAGRLAYADCVVLFRERTKITRGLLALEPPETLFHGTALEISMRYVRKGSGRFLRR